MCSRFFGWFALAPFVLTFAYAYWWSNHRQYDAKTDGSLGAYLIFFGTAGLGFIILRWCKS